MLYGWEGWEETKSLEKQLPAQSEGALFGFKGWVLFWSLCCCLSETLWGREQGQLSCSVPLLQPGEEGAPEPEESQNPRIIQVGNDLQDHRVQPVPDQIGRAHV